MLPGDPHPQNAGPDPKAKRRLQHGGLAVDPGGDRPVGPDLEFGGRPLAPRPLEPPATLAIPGRGTGDGDAEQPVVDARPRARSDRAPEPVAVVGDKDRGPRRMLMTARARPAKIESLALGPEGVGQGVEERAQLRLAVALALDRLRVDAERDVVDEYPPVHLREIDATLTSVDE